MIKDSIENASRYAGLPEGFQIAFKFLREADLANLPLGRNEISGGVWANVIEYETAPEDEKHYELHFAYADVQYVAEGEEQMPEGPVDISAYSDEGNDCCFFDNVDEPTYVQLDKGEFAIVWPGEAHKPGIACHALPCNVRKVVVKVPVK